MLPKSRSAEKEHRRQKRTREIGLITAILRSHLGGRSPRILEFGSGDGFQIPYLQQLGSLVASDVYLSNDIRQQPDVRFVQCSITDTPFGSGEFDLVFSNHVIEHVDDLPRAFAELRRIGAPGCLYAFSVPTSLWLLLSVPGQYYSRSSALFRRDPARRAPPAVGAAVTPPRPRPGRPPLMGRVLRQLLPSGHGVERRFGRCLRRFRIGTWERLFRDAGFELVETRPLLIYGASKWPLVPTLPSRGRLCSSVLFVMRCPGPAARPAG